MTADLIISGNQTITMSSREIAELLGSRHDKVKQSIERLVARGVIVQPPMGDEQDMDAMGRPRVTSVYRLDKRSSLIVVAQLSPEFTARVVDRWQQLEDAIARPAVPDFSDPEVLQMHLLASTKREIELKKQVKVITKQVEDASEKIKVMQPDVDAHERLCKAEGSLNITEAAKTLAARGYAHHAHAQ